MIRSTLRGLAAATALVVLVSSTATAQDATRFGLKAGISLPMGDFGDAVGLGIHAGGHWNLPIGNKLGLRLDADYGRYSGEDGTTVDNVSVLGGIANLVYNMEPMGAMKPYFFGGLGFYNWTVNGTGGGSFDESDLAFNVGVGYDFKLGNANLFTELRFLSIQSEGDATNMLPIVIGLRF